MALSEFQVFSSFQKNVPCAVIGIVSALRRRSGVSSASALQGAAFARDYKSGARVCQSVAA